mgnify:CR=1 FL=1
MKIAVLGAGAMGCLYGAYLSKKNQVLMIDSYRPQVEAIRESGIAVVETDGSESYYKENISAFLGRMSKKGRSCHRLCQEHEYGNGARRK